jgi:dTDP-4-amino-4,6-dideoxygalactose transaminase
MTAPPSLDDLAIDGGEPARRTPFPFWPRHDEDEVAAVTDVLRSGRVNYWTGSNVKAFEEEFAAYHGMPHAVALANGTLALELALRLLGVGRGDEVVVTPRSFFASASSIVLAGARPVFADVDRDSGGLTADSIAAAITPRTRAVMVVHLGGWPCDMPAIMALARARGLRVIEDCAQAHGATIDGQRVGTFGDVGAFSFCQDKIITTGGEGGMLVMRDRDLWSEAWSFKDHGKSWERVHAVDHPPGFRWVHADFGSNWRLTESQAAIGRIQLRKLDGWLGSRRLLALRLADGLAGVDALRIPVVPERIRHAGYRQYLFVRPDRLAAGWTRDRILAAIAAEGVSILTGSCPEIYLEQAFDGRPERPAERLPVARELGETSLSLALHPALGPEDVDDMVRALRKVMAHATA